LVEYGSLQVGAAGEAAEHVAGPLTVDLLQIYC